MAKLKLYLIVETYGGVLDAITPYTDKDETDAAFVKKQWQFMDESCNPTPPPDDEWELRASQSPHDLWWHEIEVDVPQEPSEESMIAHKIAYNQVHGKLLDSLRAVYLHVDRVDRWISNPSAWQPDVDDACKLMTELGFDAEKEKAYILEALGFVICSKCGKYSELLTQVFDNTDVCEDCAENHYHQCTKCGRLYLKEAIVEHHEEFLCQRCLSEALKPPPSL